MKHLMVSIADNNLAPLLLLSRFKTFGLYDAEKYQYVDKFTSSTNLYKSVGYIRNQIYVVEKSENFYRVLTSNLNNITLLSEVCIF